jgi:DNA-binding CsgD family transcriptional regulator/tetratricopeptide (TPR) repeat protein
MATRVTSARFIGRAAELEELCAALHDSAGGTPSLALVAGESGVGKSRLAGELMRRAREDGMRVLSGDCVELGEGELPYAPLVGALRRVAREGDEAFERLPEAQLADLATILPGLRGGPPAQGSEAEQVRVFEALLALLDAMSEEQGLLLVIEDLHWADSSTRAFVRFLARTVCNERLLVLGTYRSDELHRRHPLRPLLAELARDPLTRLLELDRLSRDEVTEQLEDILGERPDPGLVERLYTRSEGNPLFTEELLAVGLDGRGALPPTLRDALMLRVERLSAPAQEVLRWLACQSLGDDLLGELTGLPSAELREGLREAVGSQIAVAGADGSYGFRHALLREVVYDDLLPGERAELHGAIARALERQVEQQGERAHITAEVAHHWLAAGDQPAALAASVRAAAAAERVNAFHEALSLRERALGLWDRVPDPEGLAGVDQVDLLMQAANAADVTGDAARQETLLKRALDLVDEESEPRRAAAVLERLQRALWSLNRQEESVQVCNRALALLPEGDQSRERAALLVELSRARMLQSRFEEAIDEAREALEIARAIGDASVEVRALNVMGTAFGNQGDAEAGAAALREALETAERAGLPREVTAAYINLADVFHVNGRTADALAVAREGLETSLPNTRAHDWLTMNVVEFSYYLGLWREAREQLPPQSRRRFGNQLFVWRMSRAVLALGEGDLDAARADLDGMEPVARESTEPQFVGAYGWMRAELERRSGNLDSARAAVDDALDQIEYCSDDVARIAGVAAMGVRVEADAATLARDRRDEEAEQVALRRAGEQLERLKLTAEAGGPVERAELASGAAEHSRAAGPDDPELWAAAARAWGELGRPYRRLYALWRQAEALVRADDRGAAADVASEALRAGRELGCTWLVEELESLAARARLRLLGPAEPVTESDAGDEPFGLTPRELQVLALVARGATNREIGSELHMAEKTASVHVSRILAKLDVRSRTEAAAVALRQGLVDTEAAV